MQVTDAVRKLPMVSLKWNIEWEDQVTSQPSTRTADEARLDKKAWLRIPLAMECIAKVELTRINHFKVRSTIVAIFVHKHNVPVVCN